jgi:16S rRNA (guanine527-N7)-methyltransferase
LIEFAAYLSQGLETLNLKISDHKAQLMAMHAKELMQWNKKINLTAIKEPLHIVEKHFIDCIAASVFIEGKKSIIDLGSGGGFPGIPLKIINPELKVVLIDSSRKKVNFLKHVIRLLNLKNIDAIHSRVQDLQENHLYKNQFDSVISRAFTNLTDFVELAMPFLKPEGIIYAMKGKKVKNEITTELTKKFDIKNNFYKLPFEQSERYVIQLSI